MDDVRQVLPVSPLAPKDGLDERTRPGVVREISRGVGCGYIVKIDLSQDLLDETGEENGYDTDDSESDDETLSEEKYMNVAPPVRGKEQSVRINRKSGYPVVMLMTLEKKHDLDTSREPPST